MLDAGFYNMDCMEALREFPDAFFDLAVVDPPYGSGTSDPSGGGMTLANGSAHGSTVINLSGVGVQPGTASARDSTATRRSVHGGRYGSWSLPHGRRMGQEARPGGKIIAWDVAPGEDYFIELFRVSRNQIIWGANYFRMPPSRCFVVWDKTNVPENFSMAMAEYAWVSIQGNAKIWRGSAIGQAGRFHPTQKPVELYQWLLARYAKPGDKILDTHVERRGPCALDPR